MDDRWADDEVLDAAGGRAGAAVLERSGAEPPGLEMDPQSLRPFIEHGREIVVAFPGTGVLDEAAEGLLGGLLYEFLEQAPGRGHRSLAIACEGEAPFRGTLQREVQRAARCVEGLAVRLTLEPRRVDLFVVIEHAVGLARGVMQELARQVAPHPAAAVLVIAPDEESGRLFYWTLVGLLSAEGFETTAEFVRTPPEPEADLRIAGTMFALLGRGAPA